MPLIVTWHPTYAFWSNPFEWGAFSLDLDRYSRLIKGNLRKWGQHKVINPTAADVRRIASHGIVYLDIETAPETPQEPWTGKDPTRAKLKMVGISNHDKSGGCAIWWEGGKLVETAMRQVLQNPGIVKVLHNGPWFDLRVLERYGIRVNNWEDTRDGRRALSATSPLKLSYNASIYSDPEPWKEDEQDDDKGLVFTDDRTKLAEYNIQDCFETSGVWDGEVKEPEWSTHRVRNLYCIHKDLSTIAAEMHTTGFLVDEQERQRLAKELENLYHGRAATLSRFVGIKGFKCTPNHMRALIYKRHETALIHRFSMPDPIDPAQWVDDKDMKTCSVEQGALLILLTDPDCPPELHAIIRMYWHAEAAWKARSTYVTSNKVLHSIGHDGRLRAGWNSCGTDTGRFSCNSPNIMNLSEAKTEEDLGGDLPSMRAMYMAAFGYELSHADYSQLELNVMAWVSGDRALLRALATGDVYSVDAKNWFGLPQDMDVKKLKPASRKQAKIIHLASQYAAGTPTVYKQVLEKLRNAKYADTVLLHKAFKRTYEETVAYWHAEGQRVGKTGYSESRILRRRRLYPREPPITEIANYPIQATASDIVNLAMIRLWRALKQHVPSAHIVVQLHDAFDVEAPTRHGGVVRRIMQDTMEVPVIIEGVQRFPKVEIKHGVHWSDV